MNQLAGIGHYRSMPSPLRGRLIGFLDDLFIAPEFRVGGAVKQLFIHLRQECSSHGWPFVRWITKEDNQRARAAYGWINSTLQLCKQGNLTAGKSFLSSGISMQQNNKLPISKWRLTNEGKDWH
jgi:hypothetical protein